MGRNFPAIIAGVAVLLFLVWSSVFVVNEREQAIVLRFGEIVDVKSEPGIYFKAPFSFFDADNVQIVEDRVMRFDLDNIRVQVSGGKFYEVDAFVAFRISDPRTFRAAVSGQVELAEQRLRTRLDAALRRVYGVRGFESALSEERASMMREVRDQLRPDATSLGIEIQDVRIRRTDLTAEVSQQTFDRMKAERLAEAERLRARGREAAQRIRARVDREVVEIIAEARRESEILRGEGEAERNKTFADAYQRDPEFFEFYRSMIAYASALESSGTTMVLSPDSEFFRYFQSPGGVGSSSGNAAASPAAPAGSAPTAATPLASGAAPSGPEAPAATQPAPPAPAASEAPSTAPEASQVSPAASEPGSTTAAVPAPAAPVLAPEASAAPAAGVPEAALP